LPNNIGNKYVKTDSISESIYQSVTLDEDKQVLYIKLVNAGGSEKISINLDGFDKINYASNQYLTASFKSASNEIGKQRVAPKEDELKFSSGSLEVSLKENSVNVIRVAYGKNNGDSLYKIPDTVSLKTKAYVPTRIIAAVLIIATCFILGSFVGFIVYKKFFMKKNDKVKMMND
jgi:hypothetical protein